MIDLNDSKWSELQHAYGEAGDIPALLQKVQFDPTPRANPEDEPWFTLWSSLCHQGDVYNASYAAVPYLVRLALEAEGPIAPDFFELPNEIEIARKAGRGPELSSDLEKDYLDAIVKLSEVEKRVGWNSRLGCRPITINLIIMLLA